MNIKRCFNKALLNQLSLALLTQLMLHFKHLNSVIVFVLQYHFPILGTWLAKLVGKADLKNSNDHNNKINVFPQIVVLYKLFNLSELKQSKQFTLIRCLQSFVTALQSSCNKGISEIKLKQQSPCSNCMYQPVMSQGNKMDTAWAHCMCQPVMSQGGERNN